MRACFGVDRAKREDVNQRRSRDPAGEHTRKFGHGQVLMESQGCATAEARLVPLRVRRWRSDACADFWMAQTNSLEHYGFNRWFPPPLLKPFPPSAEEKDSQSIGR